MTMPVKIGAPAIASNELWQMNPNEFNKWRKNNDYPRIVDYFKNNLREFKTWLTEFHIDENELINLGIWNFLVMEEFIFFSRPRTDVKCITKIETAPGTVLTKVSPGKFKTGERYKSMTGSDCHVLESKAFQPYLWWAKKNNIKIHPQSNDGRIKVTTIEGVLSPEYCRTYVLGELELLKLGGLQSLYASSLSERDLAFVNLDFIDFKSSTIGSSYGKQIMFSSARNWNFKNSDESFFAFLDTNLENLQIINCKIYGWKWYRCEGHDSIIKDSRLNRCIFGKGSFVPYFDNVDLTDSELETGYATNNEFGFGPSIELARRMKNAFSERGRYSNAGKLYFIEETILRVDTLKELKTSFKSLFSSWKGIGRWLSYLDNMLKCCALWFSLIIQNWWWGYGERPVRVLLACLFVIILSSVLIHNLYGVGQGKTIYDSLWYSVVSFITLGDADFKPTGWIRLVVGFEGIMGILGFGFLISGFTGKNRY
jgi:hypothetical protein